MKSGNTLLLAQISFAFVSGVVQAALADNIVEAQERGFYTEVSSGLISEADPLACGKSKQLRESGENGNGSITYTTDQTITPAPSANDCRDIEQSKDALCNARINTLPAENKDLAEIAAMNACSSSLRNQAVAVVCDPVSGNCDRNRLDPATHCVKNVNPTDSCELLVRGYYKLITASVKRRATGPSSFVCQLTCEFQAVAQAGGGLPVSCTGCPQIRDVEFEELLFEQYGEVGGFGD